MSKDRKEAVERDKETATGPAGTPRSLAIAQKGVYTSSEFAALQSAVITDLIVGSLKPDVGNAVCNASGKLLKIVEMRLRYGSRLPNGDMKELQLVEPARLMAV